MVDEGLDVVLHSARLSDSSRVARPLRSTVPVVCASTDHLRTWSEPLHPEDLARHRAVVHARRDEETNTRWSFTKGGETCEVDVPVRTVSCDGIGLVDAALGGCGIARPLDVAARHWLGNGRLQVLLSDWAGEALAVTAVLPPRGRSAPAKVRRYLDHAAEVLRAQG